MALILVGSVAGAPGATTASLALAAVWPAPQPVMVVEADCSGGDLVSRLDLDPRHGMPSLAAQCRHAPTRIDLAPHLQSVRVADRRIDVLASAVGAVEATASIGPSLAGGLLATPMDATVVADVGRLQLREEAGAAWPLLATADQVLLTSSGRPDALAHLAAMLRAVAKMAGERLRLLVVEDGPYDADEISSALSWPMVAMIPYDVHATGLLRRNGPSAFVRTRLGRVLGRLAQTMTATSTPVHGPAEAKPSLPTQPVPVIGRQYDARTTPTPAIVAATSMSESAPLMWRTR
ncbi:MinD/ParA family ATP-binding protein [Fodinicola acaciae]|uniref:MinD/ParA family ATP-binding protein n=1 Tax=Fodinicola acaciae TaxID=2681555 RepID=UPI0013CFD942|nr:hypothetical protein [Fodinicola acaciae]